MSDKATKSLYQLQSLMAAAIMRPLDDDSMQKIWIDGSKTTEYTSQFIKPNKRLNSFERLEIYNQQYWYRLLDSLQEDFAGLNSLLGHKRFEKLCIAYLTRYPSHSYTLNHLGANLLIFIAEEPSLTAPDSQLAFDMASFEYAEIKALDELAKPTLKIETLQQRMPAEIILQTQPHLTLLELHYAVDSFLLTLNKEHNKTVESSAVANRTIQFSKSSTIKKRHIYVAIYRINNDVYHKRLDKDQYFLLKSLMDDKTIAEACSTLMSTNSNIQNQEKLAAKINKSFASWMELGWFC